MTSDALAALGDISAVTLHTSSPMESVDVRLSTAQLLGQNAVRHLLMDSHMMLGNLMYHVFIYISCDKYFAETY